MCACTLRICIRARVCSRPTPNETKDGMERRWQTAGRRDARYRTVRGIIVRLERQRRDERAGWSTRMCITRKTTPTRAHTSANISMLVMMINEPDHNGFLRYLRLHLTRDASTSVWRWVSSMIGGGDVKFSVSADEPQWVLYRFVWILSSVSLSLSLSLFPFFVLFRIICFF